MQQDDEQSAQNEVGHEFVIIDAHERCRTSGRVAGNADPFRSERGMVNAIATKPRVSELRMRPPSSLPPARG